MGKHNQLIEAFQLSLVSLSLLMGCAAHRGNSLGLKEPKELVFEKSSHIYDTTAFKESKTALSSKLIAAMKEYAGKEGKEMDSVLTQLADVLTKLMNKIILVKCDTTVKELYYKLQDSLIVSYIKIDDKIRGDYQIINRNNNTFYYLAKIDSSTRYLLNTPYNYRQEMSFDLKEYRKDKKIIQGIKCFKVLLRVKDDISDDAPDILKKSMFEYTLYVTKKIQCRFHPEFWYKTVLDKYYPLEITERVDTEKGAETVWKLKKIVEY